MRNVTPTRPITDAPPTICGSLFRDRGKICMGVGGSDPMAPSRNGRIETAAEGQGAPARAYTKSKRVIQRCFASGPEYLAAKRMREKASGNRRAELPVGRAVRRIGNVMQNVMRQP